MESSKELHVSRKSYITRNVWVISFHASFSVKMVIHANSSIEESFVPPSLWKAVSPLAFLATCFVLKIMRTLQAVWVFCLKIPTRGSFKARWFSVSDSCGAQVWLCCGVSCYSRLLGPVCHSWEHTQGCEKSTHFRCSPLEAQFWSSFQTEMLPFEILSTVTYVYLPCPDLNRSETDLITGIW